jgi:hypothetical protein
MRFVSAARGRWLVLPVLVALATVLSPGAATAALGNNGTVKIDSLPWDSYPNNEPHTSCTFQVDFYGYDEGDLFAKVRFWAQPPTGKKILLKAENGIFIGEDPAGGGTDVDAERTYDLTSALQEFMAHPNQGYHVKLKVYAPSSIGKDTKYKTFWVTGCKGY